MHKNWQKQPFIHKFENTPSMIGNTEQKYFYYAHKKHF